MMTPSQQQDGRSHTMPAGDRAWLLSHEAARWLETAADFGDALQLATRLRKDLSAEQTGLICEQAELRQRARAKFSLAARMLFTRKGLQQATGERLARYKAKRFDGRGATADLCCGIGGDLVALAVHGECVAVDLDATCAHFARHNAAVYGGQSVTVQCSDAAQFDPAAVEAWHIDPDRRPRHSSDPSHHTSQAEFSQPDVAALDALLSRNDSAAVKLAPAANVPDHWRNRCELEWISDGRECKQQIAWFGALANHPGNRAATVVGGCHAPGGQEEGVRSAFEPGEMDQVTGKAEQDLPTASSIGRFIYEPDAAVLAAGLAAELANRHQLAAVATKVAYFSGDERISSGLLKGFEVQEVVPFEPRKLKRLLRDRQVGRLEIKKRGVDVNPDQLRRELALKGNGSATLVVTPVAGGGITALLCQRI